MLVYRQRKKIQSVINIFNIVLNFDVVGQFPLYIRGRRGRVRMVVGFAITYAISAYHL